MATKSILQTQADNLRALRDSIDNLEKIEKTLAADVERCELELMRATSKLKDARTLIYTKRDKLNRDANDMHILIEKAINRNQEGPAF